VLPNLASDCPHGCPSSMPLVTNNPFPWSCTPCWPQHVIASFGPASWWTWWTPLHIVSVACFTIGALGLVKLVNLCFFGRGPGWMR
jgi:hypothetical protein